ncbi:MAG: hypothetical protein KC468_29810, partial [Myxococcales bacterium]|nr:hypothetical protein [Myxococcales bacterium]
MSEIRNSRETVRPAALGGRAGAGAIGLLFTGAIALSCGGPTPSGARARGASAATKQAAPAAR